MPLKGQKMNDPNFMHAWSIEAHKSKDEEIMFLLSMRAQAALREFSTVFIDNRIKRILKGIKTNG